MFVRWRRRSSGRLSARLVHNQRVGDRVRQHHVAELGAISPARLEPANTVEGIVARRAFWRTANAAIGALHWGVVRQTHNTVGSAPALSIRRTTPRCSAPRLEARWRTTTNGGSEQGRQARPAGTTLLRLLRCSR